MQACKHEQIKREKTMVFWIGLILLSLTSVVLFQILWMAAVVMYPANRLEFLKGVVPLIVGGVLFVLRGAYMTREGTYEFYTEMMGRGVE